MYITFKGTLILMSTEIEVNNCFVIWLSTFIVEVCKGAKIRNLIMSNNRAITFDQIKYAVLFRDILISVSIE